MKRCVTIHSFLTIFHQCPVQPPAPDKGKRKRSALDDLGSQKKAKERLSGTSALLSLGGSLSSMADAMVLESQTRERLGSPHCKAIAIRAIEESEDHSDEEKMQAIELVQGNTSFADAYMALSSSTLRKRYLQRQVAKM